MRVSVSLGSNVVKIKRQEEYLVPKGKVRGILGKGQTCGRIEIIHQT